MILCSCHPGDVLTAVMPDETWRRALYCLRCDWWLDASHMAPEDAEAAFKEHRCDDGTLPA